MTLSLLSRSRGAPFSAPTPLQSQVDGLVGGFAEQATNWRSLAAMMVGGMAYRAGRIGVMSASGHVAAVPLRVASVGFGLAAEVSTFELTHRALQSPGTHPSNLWRWNGQSGICQGLLQSFVTFGALKGAGRLAQGENLIAQHFLQDTAMVLGHQVTGALGIAPRPTGTLAEQFLHAEATNLQIGAGMALAHGFTPGWQGLERGLGLALPTETSPSSGPLRGGRDLAMAAAGAGVGREGGQNTSEKGPTRLFMISNGNGGSAARSDGIVSRLIREVLDRGQRTEVEALSQILLPILSRRTQGTYSIYSERLTSKDPEEWRLALRSIGHDGRIHETLEEDAAFQEFARDWMGRPHYKDLLEIRAEFDSALKHTQTLRSDLRILQHALVPDPSIDGFLKFLLNNQVGPHPSEQGMYYQNNVRRGGAPVALRRIPYDDGTTDFVGNWKRAGIRITFDPRGFLRLPIYVKKAYPADQIPSEAPRISTPAPSSSRSPQRLPGNTLAPERNESPTLWALRLIETARKGDQDTSLQIAAYLHELFLQTKTKNWVEEAMERMVSLTAGAREREGILVRRHPVPGLDQPVTLLSLPTTFLPEAWSEAFLEGMAAELERNPRRVDRLIEIGSGTGYVSVALSKMGSAGRILALDKNPHAAIVGAFNAAFNGVKNIEFRQSDYLNSVRSEESADLIVGCLPQAPSGKSSLSLSLRELADYGQDIGSKHFEDSFGLGTLARTVEAARYHFTNSESRLWLVVADRVGAPMMEDLFVRRGMHPRVLHSAQIRQASGTDLNPMVRVEEKTGFQFAFHSSEGEVLSAGQALKRGGEEIRHGLHLIEARPYRPILQTALSGLHLQDSDFRYTDEAGSERLGLQAALAENLSRQWGLSIFPETVFIGPRREALAEGILRLSLSQGGRWGWVGEKPKEALLDPLFTLSSPEFFEETRDSFLSLQKNRFDVLFLNLPRQAGEANLLRELLIEASSRGTRLVFLENHPAISNSRGRGLSQALAQVPEALSSWVLLQSLGDRFGLSELPLTAAVIPDAVLRNQLARYGDVNYSRTSSPLQSIYEPFLRRLNQDSFLPSGSAELASVSSVPGFTGKSSPLMEALKAPEIFEAGPKGAHPDPIDLSFGESAFRLPLPEVSLSSFEIHLSNASSLEKGAREAASHYLRQSRKADFALSEIILGGGVQPLLLSALRGLKRIHGQKRLEVLVPEPSYGIYFPTVRAAGPGVELKILPTSETSRFLVTPRQLLDFKRQKGAERALLINTPSNPAGQYYPSETLSDLFHAAERRGVFLLMDEVFHGLQYDSRPAPSLASPLLREGGGNRMALFGGLSKEFALAGLRFGFAASHDPEFITALKQSLTVPPDSFALKSAQELLPRWDRFLNPHRDYLARRARRMESFFRDRGFQVLPPQGGYSLFVNLNPILGGDRNFQGKTLTSENFHELLMAYAGVMVKSDRWAGVSGHYRFVYSIDRLEEALQRLNSFFINIR